MNAIGKLIKEERRQHRAAVEHEVQRKLDNFRAALKHLKEPDEIEIEVRAYEKILRKQQ